MNGLEERWFCLGQRVRHVPPSLALLKVGLALCSSSSRRGDTAAEMDILKELEEAGGGCGRERRS